VIGGEAREQRISSDSTPPTGSSKRAVTEERDAVGGAELDDAAQHVVVVPQAQLDLHRVDVGDLPRLFNLADRHVAQADAGDQAAAPQAVQGAHARRERHARIRRVQLIEVDPVDAQRAQAGFARRRQGPGAAVSCPAPFGSSQAALGCDADCGPISLPCCERAGDQPFVVAGFTGVETVGIRRVEEPDARFQCGVQYIDGASLAAIGGGREAHAADRGRPIWTEQGQGMGLFLIPAVTRCPECASR
jgi:hypothetical protein